MLKKRIIPCLDIKNGRTVKGINFEQIRDAGDPVAVAKAYADQGADELVFLDIAATQEGRKTFAELVSEIAHVINIPFTVGGGITDIADVATLLEAGADKVSVNSAAVRNPHLISDLAKRFGSQCITVAVDTKAVDGVQQVFVSGGKVPTGIHTLDWVKQAESLGAGEILLTSIEHDGTKNGFAIALTRQIVEALQIPVIASGGAGKAAHFVDVFQQAQADAALAASIFHYGQIPIPKLKSYLKQQNIPIR